MEIDTKTWLSDTRRVVKVGCGLCVNVKKDIQNSLGIVQGSLIEFRIRNTGKFVKPIIRKKKEPKVIPV